jgi:hypothetical protein
MFIKDGRQERRVGRDGRQKTTEPGPEHDLLEAPRAAIMEGTVIPARQSRAASNQRRLVWTGIGLAAAARVLRDRHFETGVIVGVLALAAVAQIGREDLARDIRHLLWDIPEPPALQAERRRQGKT